MNVAEVAAGDDGLQRGSVLECYFASLTMLAVSAPSYNVRGHAFVEKYVLFSGQE